MPNTLTPLNALIMLKIGDPYKPLDKKVLFVQTFEPKMTRSQDMGGPVPSDFSAYYAADKWLKDLGYMTGSMQRDAPIGFYPAGREYDVIAKWDNISGQDKKHLHGVLLCNDQGFREGKVFVVFCESPLSALIKNIPFKKIR